MSMSCHDVHFPKFRIRGTDMFTGMTNGISASSRLYRRTVFSLCEKLDLGN
jgi:hypothetical protein